MAYWLNNVQSRTIESVQRRVRVVANLQNLADRRQENDRKVVLQLTNKECVKNIQLPEEQPVRLRHSVPRPAIFIRTNKFKMSLIRFALETLQHSN